MTHTLKVFSKSLVPVPHTKGLCMDLSRIPPHLGASMIGTAGQAAAELDTLRLANQKLLADLALERNLRQRAEEAAQQVEALHKARDELVRSVLLAEKRAQNAEEEQLRAEQELASLTQELRQQQAGVGGGASDADLEMLLREVDSLRQRLRDAERRAAAAEPAGGAGSGGLGVEPAAASLAEAGGAAEAAAGLQQRVAALKAARDKLIAALDMQAAEVERLSLENASLVEALAELRDVAAKWEAQAQQGLAQNERLKDLLEESATWDLSSAAAEAASPTAAGTGPGVSGQGQAAAAPGGVELEVLCGRLQRELMLERARSVQLDLQVRALCMELTRSAQRSAQMQHALVPVLCGVERRLAEVLGMRPKVQAAVEASS